MKERRDLVMILSSFSTIPPQTLFSKKSEQVFRRQKSFSCTCIKIGFNEIAEISQNKVLVAATVSATIGQLLKPFTSTLLYGTNINFKELFKAGGFPSVHSAGVVAAATSLGLERGLSDSVFGMTVVFASIVMYDAQGVRREVGNHAKTLNRTLKLKTGNSNPHSENDDSKRATCSSLVSTSEVVTACSSKPLPYYIDHGEKESSITCSTSFPPLKESIGHTEIEVIAGAFLGFFVSLLVFTVM
ncbi:hypothetical protein GIB67_025429 [Kingdonia uniflora]|uniref:Acid phosphatase/vanadium-dependent haloperoxidase-related protein n=1 Tax=Kingdonia uniflora TaxID=39325 RepID=A0A7J7N1G5_9MAGN|nr:hypothetical protein GIB67_025429 [Kingdonia uniflora]